MTTKRWQNKEQYSGQGRLFEGKSHTADVNFQLQFRQQMLSVGTHGSGGSDEVAGHVEGSGTLTVLDGRHVNVRAATLELLQAGRCIDIIVDNASAASYHFVTTGELRDCRR